MPVIRAGDSFIMLHDFEQQLGIILPPYRGYIERLPFDTERSCSKQFFPYPPNGMNWINEFNGVPFDTVQQNMNNREWFRSEATATVHEIRVPYYYQNAPGRGMDYLGRYHPEVVIPQRLILGKLSGVYVFLGVYELDKNASMAYSNANPYNTVDANPIEQTIEYPHCVWRRSSLDYEVPQPAV